MTIFSVDMVHEVMFALQGWSEKKYKKTTITQTFLGCNYEQLKNNILN
jgi:hypothetical protein